MEWNRGCCDATSSSPVCPTRGANHDKNDYYEIWRYKCKDSDSCNFYAPNGVGSGSGGGAGGGIGNCEDLDNCRYEYRIKKNLLINYTNIHGFRLVVNAKNSSMVCKSSLLLFFSCLYAFVYRNV